MFRIQLSEAKAFFKNFEKDEHIVEVRHQYANIPGTIETVLTGSISRVATQYVLKDSDGVVAAYALITEEIYESNGIPTQRVLQWMELFEIEIEEDGIKLNVFKPDDLEKIRRVLF